MPISNVHTRGSLMSLNNLNTCFWTVGREHQPLVYCVAIFISNNYEYPHSVKDLRCLPAGKHHYAALTLKWCYITAFFSVFTASEEFKAFYARLPQNYFLNASAIQHLWSMDNMFQWRYEQLENSMQVLSRRAQRVIFKLFSLSKRCHRQPQVHLPRERWVQLLRHS